MSAHEGLVNLIHREVLRVLNRSARRTPCIIDSWDAATHSVRVRFQPEDTLSGLIPVQTAQAGSQFGLHIAPNINDHGWVEFHEDDREAGVFVSSMFNDNFLPVAVAPGEYLYKHSSGSSIYFKSDGTVTITDKGGSAIAFDGAGNITVTTSGGKVTINSDVTINGALTSTGNVTAGSIDLKNHIHTGVQTGPGVTGAPNG